MQTIVLVLDPGKLENPDADLRYAIPDRIEEVTNGRIQDNGYDFMETEEGEPGPLMGIWLKTESASESWPLLLHLLQEEIFMENDLSASAKIYISKEDGDELENCTLVFAGK